MTDTQPFSLASLSFVGPGAVREEQLILHEDDRLWPTPTCSERHIGSVAVIHVCSLEPKQALSGILDTTGVCFPVTLLFFHGR